MGGSGNKIIIYEPNQRVRQGFWAGWKSMFEGMLGRRELVWQLFRRDFFSKYKQSYLGIMWVLISPAIGIISWVFLNAAGVLKPGDVGVPYPVYVLIGSTVWGLFMSFYTEVSRSLTDSSSLILQINFPREVLVIKQVAQTVASFIVNLVLIFIVLLVFRVAPDWKMVFFPLTILPLLFLGAGTGMLLAVTSVVARDTGRAFGALLGFLMYLTPVIYSPETKSELLRQVIMWNPMTYLVGGSRDIILFGSLGSLKGYMPSALFSLLFFLLSWRLFYLSENKVVERL